MASAKESTSCTANLSLGFVGWLGGAVYVAHQPSYGFWDGIIWLYYVGRYIAAHFAQLNS